MLTVRYRARQSASNETDSGTMSLSLRAPLWPIRSQDAFYVIRWYMHRSVPRFLCQKGSTTRSMGVINFFSKDGYPIVSNSKLMALTSFWTSSLASLKAGKQPQLVSISLTNLQIRKFLRIQNPSGHVALKSQKYLLRYSSERFIITEVPISHQAFSIQIQKSWGSLGPEENCIFKAFASIRFVPSWKRGECFR